jgi:hypothetical protein
VAARRLGVRRRQQVVVAVDGERHSVARLISTLFQAGVEIEAAALASAAADRVVRIIVARVGPIKRALRRAGFVVSTVKVLALNAPDLGQLTRITGVLAAQAITIDHFHVAGGLAVLEVSDIQRAAQIARRVS